MTFGEGTLEKTLAVQVNLTFQYEQSCKQVIAHHTLNHNGLSSWDDHLLDSTNSLKRFKIKNKLIWHWQLEINEKNKDPLIRETHQGALNVLPRMQDSPECFKAQKAENLQLTVKSTMSFAHHQDFQLRRTFNNDLGANPVSRSAGKSCPHVMRLWLCSSPAHCLCPWLFQCPNL